MEKLLTKYELAEELNVSPRTVSKKALNGDYPSLVINKLGERRFYLSEVVKAIAKNVEGNEIEYWKKFFGERGEYIATHDNPFNEESQRAEDRIMGREENPYN